MSGCVDRINLHRLCTDIGDVVPRPRWSEDAPAVRNLPFVKQHLMGLQWIRSERAQMSKHNPVAKAINYLFEKGHWPAFTRFLTDGHVCLTNNAAERSLRGTALGRKAWLFAGSDRGGNRTAFMYSLIVTAKMNNIDPQAWLADVLARMPALTVSRLQELLPWNWHRASSKQKAA